MDRVSPCNSVTLLSASSEVHGGDQANTGALSGYVGSAEVKETSFQKGGNQANTGGLSGYVGSTEVEEMNSGTGSASDFPRSSDTLDALPPVATAEKVNQRNKNTFVWLRAPRTLVLDELPPAALPAPPAATELMPQSAATAGDFAALSASSAATVPSPPFAAPPVVQPASGSDPARLPFVPRVPLFCVTCCWNGP